MVMKTFGAGNEEWRRSLRWAEREGGELEILWSLNAIEGQVLEY